MQVSGLGVGQTASSLYVNEGIASFWKGLGFAWGREIFYTSIKLGGEFQRKNRMQQLWIVFGRIVVDWNLAMAFVRGISGLAIRTKAEW
jgi:hypothetical protein